MTRQHRLAVRLAVCRARGDHLPRLRAPTRSHRRRPLRRRNCDAIGWAAEQGIDTLVVPMPKLSEVDERASANAVLVESLAAVAPELIVLAGFMRVLGPAATGGLKCPIVNLHPALLPAFP